MLKKIQQICLIAVQYHIFVRDIMKSKFRPIQLNFRMTARPFQLPTSSSNLQPMKQAKIDDVFFCTLFHKKVFVFVIPPCCGNQIQVLLIWVSGRLGAHFLEEKDVLIINFWHILGTFLCYIVNVPSFTHSYITLVLN